MDSDGNLLLPDLLPGRYDVAIIAPGYSAQGSTMVSAGATAQVVFQIVSSAVVVPRGTASPGNLIWPIIGVATLLSAFLVALRVNPLR
jgi:hypothetical protein